MVGQSNIYLFQAFCTLNKSTRLECRFFLSHYRKSGRTFRGQKNCPRRPAFFVLVLLWTKHFLTGSELLLSFSRAIQFHLLPVQSVVLDFVWIDWNSHLHFMLSPGIIVGTQRSLYVKICLNFNHVWAKFCFAKRKSSKVMSCHSHDGQRVHIHRSHSFSW